MLSKRDVENVLNRVEDGNSETWEYWRDSGHYNCWFLAGGDWMLQVSHTENVLAINDQRDNDSYEMAAARYSDDRLGVAFVALAGTDPEKSFEHLRDQPTSSVVDADIAQSRN